MDPIARRIIFSWIATDIVWAALFIFAQKRSPDGRPSGS